MEVHVPYSEIQSKPTTMVADFLLDKSIVLEVSSFQKAHHQEYYLKIEYKRVLCENAGYIFVFCNTLAEVKEQIICS